MISQRRVPLAKRRPPLAAHTKGWLACGLGFAAGLTDAVGWLVLFRVFTSHMTGNTSSLGIDLSLGSTREAIHHLWPLAPFLMGLLFSASTTAAARRRGWHSSFSVALSTEFVLLLLFTFLAAHPAVHPGFYLMVSLPAAAMGIQTVTVTRISGLRVYTTYVTGTLSKCAEAVVEYAFWFRDRTRGRFRKRIGKILRVTLRQKYARHAILTAGLWGAFFCGALCGAILYRLHGVLALLPCLGILATAIVVDLFAPVAAADEPGSFDDL